MRERKKENKNILCYFLISQTTMKLSYLKREVPNPSSQNRTEKNTVYLFYEAMIIKDIVSTDSFM